jgi:hypothetical protein
VFDEVRKTARQHYDGGEAMQLSEIVKTHAERNPNVRAIDIEAVYEAEYLKAKNEAKLPWLWTFIVSALLAALAAILQEQIKGLLRYVAQRLSWLSESLSIRRYFVESIDRLSTIRIPFRETRPLDIRDVYVPLGISTTHTDYSNATESNPLDIHEAIRAYRRFVVKGSPGSGKSLMLKHLSVIENTKVVKRLPAPLPCFYFELRQIPKRPETTFIDAIVGQLDSEGFSGAAKYITRILASGTAVLLLDGLDEVDRSLRQDVSEQIAAVFAKYPASRAIVTCRSAVYDRELIDCTDAEFEILEFSDYQIRRFLRPWAQDMRTPKSIDQLNELLSELPSIKPLARNPLMLTLIAYLYADTSIQLPHSRAAFFRAASDLSLSQRGKRLASAYESEDIRMLLQRLALKGLRLSNRRDADRKSMPRDVVLVEVTDALKAITLDVDARELIRDIVQRTGLLLSLDGGENFQFAHLSLQEYFAAEALRDDTEELIRLVREDEGLWRETVRTACGILEDATGLISAVATSSPLTALECLAEGGEHENPVVNNVLSTHLSLLGDNRPQIDVVERSLGIVAARRDATGETVYERLMQLAIGDDQRVARSAANALASSNLSAAAELLTTLYAGKRDFRRPLLNMGDLAVASLARRVLAGELRYLKDLQEIRTPAVAEKLLPGLWHHEAEIATSIAWTLGGVLREPSLENAFRECLVTEEQQKEASIAYIWAPFDEPTNSALPLIAGRIAHLVLRSECEKQIVINEPLDMRVAIPVFAFEDGERISMNTLVRDIKRSPKIDELTERLNLLSKRRVNVDDVVDKYASIRAKCGTRLAEFYAAWDQFLLQLIRPEHFTIARQFVLKSLARSDRVELCARCLNGSPRLRDWRNIFQKSEYRFTGSVSMWTILGVLILVTLGSFGASFKLLWDLGIFVSWSTLGLTFLLILVASCAVIFGLHIKEWFDAEEDSDIIRLIFRASRFFLLTTVAIPFPAWRRRIVKNELGDRYYDDDDDDDERLANSPLYCFL